MGSALGVHTLQQRLIDAEACLRCELCTAGKASRFQDLDGGWSWVSGRKRDDHACLFHGDPSLDMLMLLGTLKLRDPKC
jgi:hypothetical protein